MHGDGNRRLGVAFPVGCSVGISSFGGFGHGNTSPAAARDTRLFQPLFLLGLPLLRTLLILVPRRLAFSFHQRIAQRTFHAGGGLAKGNQRASTGLDGDLGDLPVFFRGQNDVGAGDLT